MGNNFNHIAQYYDRLADVVFRGEIIKSQEWILKELTPNKNILILGGGTGQIIEFLPNSQRIDFVEKSSKMMVQAQKRSANQPINFIHKDFLKYESELKYDVIICPFFLDCFNQESLTTVLSKIKNTLIQNGELFVSDFDDTSTNKWISRFMHLFFGLTASLEARELLPIRANVGMGGFNEKSIRTYKYGIFSAKYVLGQ